ncbi:MAG: AlkZ family DNA glycosylase [Microbacteriaceae bacterium]|nr:AlkZ family DNA glycosylase [Microbacteriaceae bacterium]
MRELTAAEARRLRAEAQLLTGSPLAPAQVVAHFGAMQGQDLAQVLKAVAMRSRPGTTPEDVRAAFDDGSLVRGWPMRGTLFVIAPADLAGIVRITGPTLQTTLRGRRRFLGLTDDDFALAKSVAVAALAERPRSRAELAELWAEAGVPRGPGHDYHFTSTLAIDGVLALGPFEGKEQLVVPLAPPEEAADAFLVRFARAFYAARGPATLDDFAWWAKLPKRALKPAVDAIEGLEEVSVEGRQMLLLESGVPSRGSAPAELVVPGFDEWILGYQDRSLVATPEVMSEVATVNGIFRAARLVDGVVVGLAG